MDQKYLIDISKYKIISQIGSGGFCKVYLVVNEETQINFAAKISERSTTSIEQKVFYSEIEILIKTVNPSILKFQGYSLTNFQNEHFPTILTEYMINGSLDKVLESERHCLAPQEWNNTKKYINILGIALGMKYLHSQNIIHRDLKPGNILLDEHFYPRISDFGISKKLDASNLSDINMTTNAGTIYYMAPEVLSGQKYTYKVDIYSYSLIVYEIITGKLPVVDSILFQQMQKVISGKRPNTDQIHDKETLNFLTKCWSNDPSKRPSFDEIVKILCSPDLYSQFDVDIEEINEYLERFDMSLSQLEKEQTKSSQNKKSGQKSDKIKIIENSKIELETKIGFCGSDASGKFSIVDALEGRFKYETLPASTFMTKYTVETELGTVHFTLWKPCGGNIRYMSIFKSFQRYFAAVIVVHDASSELNWFPDYIRIVKESIIDGFPRIYIALNKCDLPIKVQVEDVRKIAEEGGYDVFFTSALKVETIKPMFNKIANDLICEYLRAKESGKKLERVKAVGEENDEVEKQKDSKQQRCDVC